MGRSAVFFKEGKKGEVIRTVEKRRDSWIQDEKIKPETISREQRKGKISPEYCVLPRKNNCDPNMLIK